MSQNERITYCYGPASNSARCQKQRQHTWRTDTKYKACRFQREDKHIYEAENQNNSQKQIDRETERVREADARERTDAWRLLPDALAFVGHHDCVNGRSRSSWITKLRCRRLSSCLLLEAPFVGLLRRKRQRAPQALDLGLPRAPVGNLW